MRAQYTDKHPDVIRLQREIQRLEQTESSPRPPARVRKSGQSRQVTALQAELEATILDLDRLRDDREEIVSELRRYQSRMEAIPQGEQKLLQLTRDYDNLQGSYDSLLAKRTEARLAENLERKRQSEQFTILEEAVPPTTAYSPDRRLILLVGIGLGGALGFFLSLWREQVDQSFREGAELLKAFPNVALLGVIHKIDLPKQSPTEALEEHKTA